MNSKSILVAMAGLALTSMSQNSIYGQGKLTKRVYPDELQPRRYGPIVPSLTIDRDNLAKGHTIGYKVFAFGSEHGDKMPLLGQEVRIIVGSEYSFSTSKTKAKNLAKIEAQLLNFIKFNSLKKISTTPGFHVEVIPLIS